MPEPSVKPDATKGHLPIDGIVQQHADEAALLRENRSVLLRAAHVSLPLLLRHDNRIAAHLDGLSVAGANGLAHCQAALQDPGAGTVFAAAVCALDSESPHRIEPLLELAGSSGSAQRGLLSALGWMSPPRLRGVVRRLLGAQAPDLRRLGLDACRLHGVDPGAALNLGLADADAGVRAAACRALGELGKADRLAKLHQALGDPEPTVALAAAMASCLLSGPYNQGTSTESHQRALALLDGVVHSVTSELQPAVADKALALYLLASESGAAAESVRKLADQSRAQPGNALWRRRLLRACGLLGEKRHVAWLIEQMADRSAARLAGESFSWITGADLAALGFDQTAPDEGQAGASASEDPEDEDVSLDADESLPWPKVAAIRSWWAANSTSIPADVRLFMGQAAGAPAAARVLHEGGQRQRALAAIALCLARPGTPLFNVAAPAWRQRRLLADMFPAAARHGADLAADLAADSVAAPLSASRTA